LKDKALDHSPCRRCYGAVWLRYECGRLWRQ